MSTESHDKMIRAFQEYFKWQDRFENRGSDEAGIKARNALHEIRKLAFTRRQEIQEKRAKRKLARNGKPGPPTKLTKDEAY